MTEAYELASTHSRKSAELDKVQYDKRVRHTTLHEGDRVLLRNLPDRDGPGKLRPYQEQEIYVVTQKRRTCQCTRTGQRVEVGGPEFFTATSYYHALTYLLKLR